MRQMLLGPVPLQAWAAAKAKAAPTAAETAGTGGDGGGAKKRKAGIAQQKWGHFLVLDFEATCRDGEKLHPQAGCF